MFLLKRIYAVLAGRREALDMRPCTMAGMRLVCAATRAATRAAASEAADDDAEEGGDGVDDAPEDTGNTVDDGHDSVTDGAEAALDLVGLLDEVQMVRL